jgi:hypothetical protein
VRRRTVILAKLKDAIVHPLGFAVFPVLSLYVKNMGKGYLGEAMAISAGILVVAALLWLCTSLLVKDRRKSAIVVSVFLLLFFSYGHIVPALSGWLQGIGWLDKAGLFVTGTGADPIWIVVWGILFAVASYLIVRSSGDLRQATSFLNIVALALVATVGIRLVASGVNMFVIPRIRPQVNEGDDTGEDDRSRANDFISSWLQDSSSEDANTSSEASPDIYYVILDMYARADILDRIYQFDNSEFLSFLADRGFYVADESRSNYPHTTHSLASSLNLTYLDDVAAQVGVQSTNFWPLVVMIRNNTVMGQLHNLGYTTMAFSTGYVFTEMKDTDIYVQLPGRPPSDFQITLTNLTPLAQVAAIGKRRQDSFRREQILYTIDHLSDATEIEAPAFVFAHVPAPHPPYVFGANGEPVPSRPEEAYDYAEYVEAYTNQLAFVSKRLGAEIDEILAQSSEPPIIVLQADHGPVSAKYTNDPASYFPERMSIFNAYYFPDQDYDTLYEDITPVNTFRVIFNAYFGTDYERLEDKSYFSDYWDSPYLFEDVTDNVLSDEY